MLRQLLSHLDLQRIAGISSILGIDLTEERARIVEVRKKGNILNRFKGRYEAVKSFSVEFPHGQTPEQKSKLIKTAFSEHGVTSKCAVSSIQSLGVKTVGTIIPPSTRDLAEWIKDNSERLLGLPIPANQVSHQWEVFEASEAGILAEITFARNAELEQLRRFIQSAGLRLIGIGATDRDALNALLVQGIGGTEQRALLIHCNQSNASLRLVQNGTIKLSKMVALDDGEQAPLEHALNGQLKEKPDFVFAGDVPDGWMEQKPQVLSPLGLPTQYTLAVGLAMKGFLPELSPVDFIDAKEKEASEILVYKSVFQRTTIALGAMLVLLLLVPFLVDQFIQARLGRVDEQTASSAASYAEVASIEKSVHEIAVQFQGSQAGLLRTNVAGLMHDIANVTPHGVWLYKVSLSPGTTSYHLLNLRGYTREGERVTDYLKALGDFCSDVRLVRLGSPLESENMLPKGNNQGRFTTFEINARVK